MLLLLFAVQYLSMCRIVNNSNTVEGLEKLQIEINISVQKLINRNRTLVRDFIYIKKTHKHKDICCPVYCMVQLFPVTHL